MAKERSGAMLDQNAAAGYGSVAAQWRSTRWGMVSIQFVMTMAFSVLSPINPLLLPELGVETEGAVDLWAGILGAVTSFVAAFASPLWGRLEPRHRRIHSVDGRGGERLAVPRLSRADGRVRRFFQRVWIGVRERFVAPQKAGGGRSILGSLIAVANSPGLLSLFFVLLRGGSEMNPEISPSSLFAVGGG